MIRRAALANLPRLMNRFAATLALVLVTPFTHAIELPQQRLAPGGVARVALGAAAEPPRASFNGVPVMVVREGSQWLALVGIGLARSPGPAALMVQRGGTESPLAFQVKPFRYAEQILSHASYLPLSVTALVSALPFE